MGFFSATRDRFVESVALGMLNRSVLQSYGRITTLTLNSQAKTIEFDLDLKGERESVHVQVSSYELIEENGRVYLVPRRISTSREWLTALAGDFISGRRFELPPEAASVAAQLL